MMTPLCHEWSFLKYPGKDGPAAVKRGPRDGHTLTASKKVRRISHNGWMVWSGEWDALSYAWKYEVISPNGEYKSWTYKSIRTQYEYGWKYEKTGSFKKILSTTYFKYRVLDLTMNLKTYCSPFRAPRILSWYWWSSTFFKYTMRTFVSFLHRRTRAINIS